MSSYPPPGAPQGEPHQQPYQQPGQPYQQQGAYQAPQPGYAPYGQAGPGYANPEAQQASQTSLVLGIIGLFVLGIILGPLAIMKANEAQRGGVDATAGKIVGWIATILHALGVVILVFMFLSMASFFAAVS